ncbi:hypothetical protein LIER_24174 [Lithospermum erythrorhizon]|uniref:Uncharacterized protein n=1 Tax=Lithospermum erythrorhizon TaxID=34254 RepID=A0AAV3R2D0_LITER
MEDDKPKDGGIASESSHNKVDIENAHKDVNDQTTQTLQTNSTQHFGNLISCQEATPNVTSSVEALLPNDKNEFSSSIAAQADGASQGTLLDVKQPQVSVGGNSSSSVITQSDEPMLDVKQPEEPVGGHSSSRVSAQSDGPLPDVKQPQESLDGDSSSSVKPQESVGGNSSSNVVAQPDKPLLGVIQPQESIGENSSNSAPTQSDKPLLSIIQPQESVGGNSPTRVAAQSDRPLLDIIQPQESVDGNSLSSAAAQSDRPSLDATQPHIEAKKRVLTISYSSPEMHLNDSSLPQVRDVANVQASNSSPRQHIVHSKKEVVIDTTTNISVKHAVSRFGGIVDWKAHKAHTMERRKFIQLELEKAHEEIPVFKRLCEAAEEEKLQFLKKLNSSKRLNEELKLNLERAQTEEQQAKQDSELAILRMEELEQGIADEVSKAAKAQLEVARARHASAVSELKIVQDELQQLQQDFTNIQAEKGSAVSKARESVAESKEVEKRLEELSIELINTKDSLETAQASHLEAEEQRAEKTTVLEQDMLKFEKEIRDTDEELERLNNKFASAKNVKAQLATSLDLLQKLKGELGGYMESQKQENPQETEENLENKNRGDMQAAVTSTKMDLEETRANIKKATDEVNSLKESATSLETELSKIKLKIAQMQEEEEEVDLPEKLQHAKQDTNPAKLLVELRGEEYKKAKEEATQLNIEKSNVESRLLTVQKEIELAKACEKLASDAIKEPQESGSSDTINEEDSQTKVPLSLEEYYGLNMGAHEAEEGANKKVLAALSEIDAAKESELESINKLNEANNEIAQIKEELEIALQKVNLAKEGKLNAEEELRKWRTKQQIQKADGGKTPQSTTEAKKESENLTIKPNSTSTPGPEEKAPKKKKKSIFPRFFMFMGKKKSSSKSK